MATQPQQNKNKGGNLKKELAIGQVPPGTNSVESNTKPQLAAWRKKYPEKQQVWTKG